jgi:hypothetical protein
MLENGLLDKFSLPEGAAEDLAKQAGVFMQPLQHGVQVMSGHDNGVAFRFFNNAEKNEIKSKAAKVPLYNNEDMIEWNKGKRNKPTEKVRFLPPEFLFIDEDGEVTGRPDVVIAYKRYKMGQSAPGTPLNKWGAMDDAQIKTLMDCGIFSVEQFAASPRSKIQGKFPQDIIDKFEEAIQYVNGQSGKFEVEAIAQKAVELEQRLAKKDQAIEELQQQVKQLMGLTVAPKNKGGRPKKIVEAKITEAHTKHEE